ncbi:MAG: glycoside hydrolase family 9 protein [Eubacteriales bacterium]|nr:glycoside hydrolase family 9 protein [Eubacteriales bacterium]
MTGRAPAECYIDDTMSYSTNEVTIYWNSAMIYCMALLA